MNARTADSIDSPSQATSDQHRRTPLYEDMDPHQLRVVCVVPASVPKWLARVPGYALEHEWLKWTMLPVEALSATAAQACSRGSAHVPAPRTIAAAPR
jgi:hypothetical protein